MLREKKSRSQVTSRDGRPSLKSAAGFTLVELIVVIAILGILAGIGTVAYTGYIKRAQKGVDQQLMGDLVYASYLADYADPSLFGENGVAYIVATPNGVEVAGTTDSGKFKTALEDAVGDLDALGLTGDWSGSGAVSGAVLSTAADNLSDYMSAVQNTTDNPTGMTAGFASEMGELWDTVEGFCDLYEKENKEGKTAGEFLKQAADSAVSGNAVTVWASGDAIVGTEGGLKGAGAVSVVMARNYAFASYLAKRGTVSSTDIQCFKTMSAAADDLFAKVYGGKNGSQTDDNVSDVNAIQTLAQSYISSGQAKLDALAYTGIMKTVVDKTEEGDGAMDPTDEGYMKAMGSYANIAAVALNGTDFISLKTLANSLNDGSNDQAIVAILKKSNGRLVVDRCAPEGVYTGETASGESGKDDFLDVPTEINKPSKLTLVADGTAYFDVSGPIVLKAGSSNKATLTGNIKMPDGYDTITKIGFTLGDVTGESTTKPANKTSTDGYLNVIANVASKKGVILVLQANDGANAASAQLTLTFTLTSSSTQATATSTLSTTLWGIQ